MPVSPKGLADEIAQHMRRNGLDVLTMRWPAFYAFCGRERLKAGFVASLADQLAGAGILYVAGESVVALVKDSDFAPMPG